jgi:hypothetical protein
MPGARQGTGTFRDGSRRWSVGRTATPWSESARTTSCLPSRLLGSACCAADAGGDSIIVANAKRVVQRIVCLRVFGHRL